MREVAALNVDASGPRNVFFARDAYCGLTHATGSHGVARELLESLQAKDYSGYDPYDALNSRLSRLVPDRAALIRRLAVQAVKRCPISLEPFMGIARQVNSYTLGHALLTAVRLAGLGLLPDADVGIADLLTRLQALAVCQRGTMGWGYPFPVAVRFTSYPACLPNVVATSFVAKGLAHAHLAGIGCYAADMERIAAFILRDLPRTRSRQGQCFGYTPSYGGIVHNANALAAQTLALAFRIIGNESYRDEAIEAARFIVAHQRPDGSWPYAEADNGGWVDGFHTGFTLDGLAVVAEQADSDVIRESVARGFRFYTRHLFTSEGAPAYYADGREPFDALSAAQGIETLATLGRGDREAEQLLSRLVTWTHTNVIDSRNRRVAYQVHRHWTDWRQFPRWSIAPLASALAGLGLGEAGKE